jgi:hypothetical protein
MWIIGKPSYILTIAIVSFIAGFFFGVSANRAHAEIYVIDRFQLYSEPDQSQVEWHSDNMLAEDGPWLIVPRGVFVDILFPAREADLFVRSIEGTVQFPFLPELWTYENDRLDTEIAFPVFNADRSIREIPEPSTWALLMVGFGALLMLRRFNGAAIKGGVICLALWGSLGLCKANTIDCSMVMTNNDRVVWNFEGSVASQNHVLTETGYTKNGVVMSMTSRPQWTMTDTKGGLSVIHSIDWPEFDIVMAFSDTPTFRGSMLRRGASVGDGVCIVGSVSR